MSSKMAQDDNDYGGGDDIWVDLDDDDNDRDEEQDHPVFAFCICMTLLMPMAATSSSTTSDDFVVGQANKFVSTTSLERKMSASEAKLVPTFLLHFLDKKSSFARQLSLLRLLHSPPT